MTDKYYVKEKGNRTWSSAYCSVEPKQHVVNKVGELVSKLDSSGSGIISIEGINYGFTLSGFRPATKEEIDAHLGIQTYEIY